MEGIKEALRRGRTARKISTKEMEVKKLQEYLDSMEELCAASIEEKNQQINEFQKQSIEHQKHLSEISARLLEHKFLLEEANRKLEFAKRRVRHRRRTSLKTKALESSAPKTENTQSRARFCSESENEEWTDLAEEINALSDEDDLLVVDVCRHRSSSMDANTERKPKKLPPLVSRAQIGQEDDEGLRVVDVARFRSQSAGGSCGRKPRSRTARRSPLGSQYALLSSQCRVRECSLRSGSESEWTTDDVSDVDKRCLIDDHYFSSSDETEQLPRIKTMEPHVCYNDYQSPA